MSKSLTTKNIAAVAIGLGLVLALGFAFATPVKAQSIGDLQVQIQALLAQIASLQGGSTASGSCITFTRNHQMGDSAGEVMWVQQFLNKNGAVVASVGAGSPGNETNFYGGLTKSAVAKFQIANGIAPAAGFWGPITRAKANSMCTPGPVTPTPGTPSPSPSGPLQGGAGDIGEADLISSLSNEEVGEGEEDVEVAALEIEAEGSDIELRAVTLDFDELASGNDDLDEYATEISLSLDGEEIARIDAEDFEDDNDFTETITLDSGAIIREGDTAELTVSVSAVTNLDTNQEGDEFNVGFESVRYIDAQGGVVTDDSTGDIGDNDDDTTTDSDERAFSFESFATAADIELKVSEGSDDINDARSIAVDDSDNTDDVEVLSFEIEAEGNSDLTIDDLSIDFTSVGAGVGEIINDADLVVDGDVIGSASTTIASTTATTMTVTFDDLDWTIDAGDTIEVTLTVDVNDLDGAFLGGETLSATVNPDDAAWDVEDEEGDALGASDKTGTASSEAHSFYADGLNIVAGGADSTDTDDTNGDTAGGERGEFTIRFDVTAFGDTLYIPLGATIATSSVDTDDGVSYAIENSDGEQVALNAAALASTTAVVSSTADTSGQWYVIDEGETESFTLTLTLVPLADGFFRAQLYGVNFNVAAAAVADTLQVATPTTDFETDYENIDV